MANLDKIWFALPKKAPGVSAVEIAEVGVASEPYTRRVLRQLAEAGMIKRSEKGPARDDAYRYYRTARSPDKAPSLTREGEVISREPAMTAAELAIIRRRTGHSLASMGRALGWTGVQPSISRSMRRFESGDKVIDESLAARVRTLAPYSPA